MKKYVSLLAIMSVVGFSADAFAETNAGSEHTCNVDFLQSDESATFVADFTPVEYSINYALNDGAWASGYTPTTIYTIESADITLGTPTRTGYTFDGWNVTSAPTEWGTGSSTSGANPFTIKTGTYGNIAFSALWSANSGIAYKVCRYTKDLGATTYTLNGGECQDKNGTADSTITLANEATNITGFTYDTVDGGFAGISQMTAPVTKPASGAVATTTILADGSRVISLFYGRDTHTVTLNPGTGVASVSGAGTYEYGAAISVGGTCSGGYNNFAWNTTPISTMGTSNVEYTATCSTIPYTITYNNMTDATNFAGAPANYNVESATITLGTPTKVGYTFGGWWTTSNFAVGTQVTEITSGSTGDKQLYAKWTAKTVGLSYVDGVDNSVINTTPTSCEYDTTFNLPDTPTKAGYTFGGWELQTD